MLRIVLILRPAFNRQGQRLHGKFEARLDGRLICVSGRPLLDGARVLAAEGVDPATPISMRHAGAAHNALGSSVGHAAKLTVRENEKDGPRFVRWEPFSHRRVHAPMRFDERPAPDTGDNAERAHAGAAS